MTLTETLAWLVDIPSETGQEGRIASAIAERLLPVYGPQGVERIGNSLVVGHRGAGRSFRSTGTRTRFPPRDRPRRR